MSTSEYGGLIVSVNTRMDNDSPLSASYTRDLIVNNLQHAYDQSPQHLVNAPLRAVIDHTPTQENVYEFMTSFGPFAALLDRSGAFFPFVCMAGGSVSDDAEKAEFLFVLSSHVMPRSTAAGIASVHAETQSEIVDWMTMDDDGLFTVGQQWPNRVSATVDVEVAQAGATASATYHPLRLDVWCMSADTASHPRLAAVHLRQYGG